jgi:acetate kinase
MTSTQRPVPGVLTVNAGSSSLRLASYALEPAPRCTADIHLSPAPACNRDVLVDFVRGHALAQPDLVIHRVVHGGAALTQPCLIDTAVEAEIERLQTLAPLHNGVALDWIRAARDAFDIAVAQAACFDTGFYADLPSFARTYALPKALCEQHGIRRYGFHGLAHQSMLNHWRELSHAHGDRRVISLQLGGGCSVTATKHGRPIETSMGFSPLGGLMMGTRCGDLDPAVVLHLIGEGGFSSAELGWIFNESSGLLGVSGQSGDVKTLIKSETDDAALAMAMFCHQLRAYIGAYLAVLGGADAILFGGGIGENAPLVRSLVIDHLDWAGIRLDAGRNDAVNPGVGDRVHADASAVEVWVIPTDEGQIMAEAASALLSARISPDQPTTRETHP